MLDCASYSMIWQKSRASGDTMLALDLAHWASLAAQSTSPPVSTCFAGFALIEEGCGKKKKPISDWF